jgi:hypothetical protein
MVFGVQYVTTTGEHRTQESYAECYVMSEYKMKNTTLSEQSQNLIYLIVVSTFSSLSI